MVVHTLDLFSLVSELLEDCTELIEIDCVDDKFLSIDSLPDEDDISYSYDPIDDVYCDDYNERFHMKTPDAAAPLIFSLNELALLRQALENANENALHELDRKDISSELRSAVRNNMKENDTLVHKLDDFLSHFVQCD